jgi:predicted nucleic acid-binding protein
MMREVLLDTDMLIAALDGNKDKDDVVEKQRRRRVKELSSDPEVRLRITPLIYYELMRDVRHRTPAEIEADLKHFDQTEIRAEHGRRAAELYRLAKEEHKDNKDEWLDRRRFDVFHCVCAELDGLEFVSGNDKDILKIQQLINDHPRQP